MKKNFKSIISVVLIMAMTLTMVLSFAGCSSGANGNDGITPQLRINAETNYWEVSYDEGETWDSMGVKATGEDGKDGLNGKDGVDGKDGLNGKDGADGKDGVDGAPGKDGVDGAPGKEGIDGEDGKDGIDGTNGTDGKDFTVTDILNFITFLKEFGYNALSFSIDELTDLIEEYSTFKTVSGLMKNVNLGNCDYQGTDKCLASVYCRPFVNDKGYYNNAKNIERYLLGVFVEDSNGVVTVARNSNLMGASYRSEALTVLNFALAFDGYEEYAIRNGKSLPTNIQNQKNLAIKYFNTVDYTKADYNTAQNRAGYTFCAQAVSDIALGSLLGQAGTDRYDTLIKSAYDNLDANFWAASKYIDPFYQLCADYSWFDDTKLPNVTGSLTSAEILNCYAFGINVAKDYPDLWETWVETALSNNALDATEAKVFTYHYAYQIKGGNVDLGAYGNSRTIVDYSKFQ